MNHATLRLDQWHRSDVRRLEVLVRGTQTVNDGQILVWRRVLRWPMYDRLLDHIHTDDGTRIGVAEGNGDGNVLIGHWNGKSVSDDRLHWTDREGSSGQGGKGVRVRVGREVLRWRGGEREERDAVLHSPRIRVETLRSLPREQMW